MATQIPQKIVVNSLKLLFISTSFASCSELLYNGNFLNYFLQVKKVYRRLHLDRRITVPISVYCLSFTFVRWTLAPVLMGWQNLAKLSLCLADQYSSTSMSIYDNDQYSLGQWWSVCLWWWWWWWWQWWWPVNWSAPHLLAQLTLLQEYLQLIIDGSTCCRIPFHLELKERTWNLGIYQERLTNFQKFFFNRNLNIRDPTILQCCQEFLHLITDDGWLFSLALQLTSSKNCIEFFAKTKSIWWKCNRLPIWVASCCSNVTFVTSLQQNYKASHLQRCA